MNYKNKTILLVEDEAINAVLNKRTLEKFGYDVIHASSGEQAVFIVQSVPIINMILMDIDLGDGIDGTEAAEIILQLYDIPLVFLSSHTEYDIVKKTEKITSYGYIVKNTGETVLIASIKMAFRLFDAKKKEEEREKKLREGEEMYRSIFENTGTSMFLVESDMTIAMVNDDFVKRFGYTKEEVSGIMKWPGVIHPDSWEYMFNQHKLRRVDEKAASKGYELKYKTKTGEVCHGYITVGMIPGTDKSIASITDLTELKKAELAIKERNEELAAMNEEFEAANEELIQTLTQLEDREKEYLTLFETSSSGIFVISSGNISIYNHAVTEITGYNNKELLGRSLLSFIYPDDIPFLKEQYERLMKAGEPEISFPLRIITPGSKIKWIGVKSGLTMWNGKSATLNFISDITDRMEAENAIKESESKYRRIFENTQDVFYQTSVDGTILELSPSVENHFGFSRDEMIGKSAWQVYSEPAERERFIQALLNEKKVFDYELRLKNRDNQVFVASTSSRIITDPDTGELRIEGTIHNITRRKQAEEALIREKERLAGVIEGTNAGSWEWNIRTGEVVINDRWAEMIGYTPEELSPVSIETWYNCLHPEDLGRCNELLSTHFRSELDYYEAEVRMWHRSGRWIWVLDRGKVTKRDADGKPLMMMGTHQDITKNKEAEEKIRRINNAKSMYLARMTHEIRTPLSAVTGMIELALAADNENDRLDYLNTAKQSSSHLISLINDVLDYSRIESGALTLESVPFDPVREIESVTAIFYHICSAKDLLLNLDTSRISRAFTVSGDPTRFRQILINIVGNAVKFTESGGIDVIAEYTRNEKSMEDRDLINLNILIRDTGPGIPSGKLELIFENFIQADASISSKYGGTGLGLAISKELVEMMGGTISVLTEEGLGSLFVVNIPFREADAPAADIAVPVNVTKRCSVLVAEDDAVNLKFIKAMLEKSGHTVVTAGNGRDVIDILSGGVFDVILMDIEMPEIGGMESAGMVRKGEAGIENMHIPIIALSAYNTDEISERCLKAGFDGVLAKPVNVEVLNSLISRLIREGEIGDAVTAGR